MSQLKKKKIKQLAMFERAKLDPNRFSPFGDYVNEQITQLQLNPDISELTFLFASDATIVVSFLKEIEID